MSGHRVALRWQDLDALGHVNHATVLTFLEEGRDAWLAEHGIARDQYVVGRCSVEYLAEIGAGQRAVSVECAVRDLGRSSVTTTERIRDEAGRVVVEATFGLVLWDPAQRRSRPITDDERARLARSEEPPA